MSVVGEQKGMDMRENQDAYEDPELLDKISKNLSEVDGLDSESVDDSTPIESDDSADDDDSTPPMPKAKKAADDSDSTPDDEDENKSAEGDTDADDKPAIPDNYYRAAVHQGWEPEDIQELYDANPDLALKTLKKLHEDTNKVSQVFAEKGRLAAQQQQTQIQSQQQPQQPVVVQTQQVDMNKLKEQYENDPFGAMAELIKATVGQQQQQQPQQQEPQQPTVNQLSIEEQFAAYTDVVNFFKDKSMADYEVLYGTDVNNLTPGQKANRSAVTETADAIIDGMLLEGKQISNTDALMRAHLIVSAPVAEQVVRNKLVKSAKKREKGMTLRSSKTKSPTPKLKRGEKSTEQRVSEAQARLDNMQW